MTVSFGHLTAKESLLWTRLFINNLKMRSFGNRENLQSWKTVDYNRFMFGLGLVWFDFCFTALQHILGHFGRGQLT